MNKIYKTTSIIFLIFVLAGIGYLIYDRPGTSGLLNFGGEAIEPIDIFGTRAATSTTATDSGTFLNPADAGHATTTKAIMLSSLTNEALITFSAIEASSTSWFQYDIFGSNDAYCDATGTSTTDDAYTAGEPFVQDIYWFPAKHDGDLTTLVTNPAPAGYYSGTSTDAVLLENFNWRCLRFDLKGASTTVWSQIKQKIN